jgi:hypothetical protein
VAVDFIMNQFCNFHRLAMATAVRLSRLRKNGNQAGVLVVWHQHLDEVLVKFIHARLYRLAGIDGIHEGKK